MWRGVRRTEGISETPSAYSLSKGELAQGRMSSEQGGNKMAQALGEAE